MILVRAAHWMWISLLTVSSGFGRVQESRSHCQRLYIPPVYLILLGGYCEWSIKLWGSFGRLRSVKISHLFRSVPFSSVLSCPEVSSCAFRSLFLGCPPLVSPSGTWGTSGRRKRKASETWINQLTKLLLWAAATVPSGFHPQLWNFCIASVSPSSISNCICNQERNSTRL